ncbi:MAG: FAD-dependent pyridine nucleotide-disulfide oxidoreductase [Solirubrobacterales bacterium]|nr:FAD-dependent pyridine nucleotide-disulfide oxidoreductase [Solirubrobacterales bacterium]
MRASDGRCSVRAEYLLIGGGMAAGNCAAELRKRDPDGSVMVVGREPEPPYERPPLSKEYLRGDAERKDAYVNDPGWYEENAVELRTKTNVMSFDAEGRTAKLQGGDEVEFEKALLATGANVNILRVEGAELEGIHYLRAFGNSDAIRADAEKAGRVVLIGGSYIGCEVAASLTARGTECAVVMMEDVALSRTFGEDAGRWFQGRMEEHGVEFHGGETLAAFEGDAGVSAVVTESGKTVEGDFAVVGAGVKPDVMLAERAGLEVENGIVCDCTLQTSVEGIYAAGDVCSYESVVHGHVVPYFFSDLADWASLEYVGPAYEWDEEVWRGDRDAGEFSVFYLEDGKVAGALAVGRSEDLGYARELLAKGTDVSGSKDVLADADADLGPLST